MILASTIVFAFLATAQAGCDNSCSGHGVCECGFCVCYDNWGMGLSHDTGDCSDRICPFEFAWVDSPDVNGIHHKYAECANKGICNRGTGECECFEGYEGKGCQRTSCPNDCSGHGTCEYIQDLGFGATPADFPQVGFTQDNEKFTYYNWDVQKTRGCVCDPEWGDVDCSKRLCMYGTDTQDHRDNMLAPQKYQVQQILFDFDDSLTAEGHSRTFALTFKSKVNETFTTHPIVFTSDNYDIFANDVANALLRLPNRVIDMIDVKVDELVDADTDAAKFLLKVKFTGANNQGDQNLLIVEDFSCGDGCFPKVTGLDVKNSTFVNNMNNISMHISADFNSYECGRRGKCDYETGICQCFEGFTGNSCNQCTSLI